MLPDIAELDRIITAALAEDIGAGDVTSGLIASAATARLACVARQPLIMCGGFIAKEVYRRLDPKISVRIMKEEGALAPSGDTLVVAEGGARALLTGERVVLNLMQRMCGVASLTRQYVDAVRGTKAVILDTRKTMPGLRALDKYAVRTGGGQNHRLRLDDMILIKDNHLALAAKEGVSLSALVARARASSTLPVVVECDTIAQVKEALGAKPDRILLDNMTPEMLREAVRLASGNVPLEASGGVTLAGVRAVAETGVDYISVGALTHSAPAADIGADVVVD